VLRASSRLIVAGDRPKRLEIKRIDSPPARPNAISRSAREMAFPHRELIASSIPGVVHRRPPTRFGTVTDRREGPRTVVSSGGR
jgi:hypothetical protein